MIAAIVPSTNPAATPANNIINALKCGNAIVVAPSPKGVATCKQLLDYIHAEFTKIGEDPDLVQMIPAPGSKQRTQRLMELCDKVIATGSQNNVHRAQTCGTPAVAVGAGNVAVIVDETADLTAAAEKIRASKTFDNATSCSSENAVVVVDAVYDAFVNAMGQVGGAVVADEAQIVAKLWPDGYLNRAVIAQDADKMIAALGLDGDVPAGTEYIAVPTAGIGPDYPLSGEKLSRVLALYRATDFDAAVATVDALQRYQGAGHSVGLHSGRDDRAMTLATQLPTSRIIVNQAHTFATGGRSPMGCRFPLAWGAGRGGAMPWMKMSTGSISCRPPKSCGKSQPVNPSWTISSPPIGKLRAGDPPFPRYAPQWHRARLAGSAGAGRGHCVYLSRNGGDPKLAGIAGRRP